MKSKSYYGKMRQNNSTELSGYSFLNMCSQDWPKKKPRSIENQGHLGQNSDLGSGGEGSGGPFLL